MSQKITRFQVRETVTLESLHDPRFMLLVIYGRKKTERARFKHQFVNPKDAEKMYDEMQQFVGMPLEDFLKNELQKEIQKRYEGFHSPFIKMQPA